MIKAEFSTFSIVALVLLSLPSRASDTGRAGFDLPQPNGCHPVGTTMVVLRDPRRGRDLLVTIWYPAKTRTKGSASAPAPYMDRKTADALAEEWKLLPNFERLVRTHARLRAPVAMGGPFPVILLEHGSSVVPAIARIRSRNALMAASPPPTALKVQFRARLNSIRSTASRPRFW